MRLLIVVIALIGAASAPLVARAQWVDDPFSDYLQRSDTILLGAGNANNANAAIHTITPWPPYVGNTRIRIDGRRSVDSVESMHRIPNPFVRQGAGTGAAITGQNAAAAIANTLAAPPSPVQPLSSGN